MLLLLCFSCLFRIKVAGGEGIQQPAVKISSDQILNALWICVILVNSFLWLNTNVHFIYLMGWLAVFFSLCLLISLSVGLFVFNPKGNATNLRALMKRKNSKNKNTQLKIIKKRHIHTHARKKTGSIQLETGFITFHKNHFFICLVWFCCYCICVCVCGGTFGFFPKNKMLPLFVLRAHSFA